MAAQRARMLTICFFSFIFLSKASADSLETLFSIFQIQSNSTKNCAKYYPEKTLVKPTNYRNCEEEMPVNLRSFQTEVCRVNGMQAGTQCLNYTDRLAIGKLKKENPTQYLRYTRALEINDTGNSQACIRYRNGVMKAPRIGFLSRTKELSEFIKETAAFYEIPPESITCAIGGDAMTTSRTYPNQLSYENPMIQRRPIDEAMRDLSKRRISLINAPAPRDGMSITEGEINSIRNAALILKHAKVMFQEQGFSTKDLSSEILTSIYHLGVYRGNPRINSAVKKKQSGKPLGMSFLGFTCFKHKQLYQERLGL